METGYCIKESMIVTRRAEGAIAFASGARYAPVIAGTGANQVKAATSAATTVVGFVKKPTTKDSIADGDTVDVVIEGLLSLPIEAASTAMNAFLQVGTDVTKLNTITLSGTPEAELVKIVGRAKQVLASAGFGWVKLGGF